MNNKAILYNKNSGSWNLPLKTLSIVKDLISNLKVSELNQIKSNYTLTEIIDSNNVRLWISILKDIIVEERVELNSILYNTIVETNFSKEKIYLYVLNESYIESIINDLHLEKDIVEKFNIEKEVEYFIINKDKSTNFYVKVFLSLFTNSAFQQIILNDINRDERVIIKYTKSVVYSMGWNNYYEETRGLIIDVKKMIILASPLKKFYNLEERLSINEFSYLIQQEGIEIEITDKEDGSMGTLYRFNGNFYIATPGSLESEQAFWATEFINKNYADTLKRLPDNLTLVFEIIYPENRVVRNYKGQEKIILTTVRNMDTGYQYSYSEIVELNKEWGFNLPYFEKKSFFQLVEDRNNSEMYPAQEKEGWVIRLENKKTGEVLFVKLKCEEYCKVHKIISDILSPKSVYEAMLNDTIDDMIGQINNEQFKQICLELIAKIHQETKNLKENVRNVFTNFINTFKRYNDLIVCLKEYNEFTIDANKEVNNLELKFTSDTDLINKQKSTILNEVLNLSNGGKEVEKKADKIKIANDIFNKVMKTHDKNSLKEYLISSQKISAFIDINFTSPIRKSVNSFVETLETNTTITFLNEQINNFSWLLDTNTIREYLEILFDENDLIIDNTRLSIISNKGNRMFSENKIKDNLKAILMSEVKKSKNILENLLHNVNENLIISDYKTNAIKDILFDKTKDYFCISKQQYEDYLLFVNDLDNELLNFKNIKNELYKIIMNKVKDTDLDTIEIAVSIWNKLNNSHICKTLRELKNEMNDFMKNNKITEYSKYIFSIIYNYSDKIDNYFEEYDFIKDLDIKEIDFTDILKKTDFEENDI